MCTCLTTAFNISKDSEDKNIYLINNETKNNVLKLLFCILQDYGLIEQYSKKDIMEILDELYHEDFEKFCDVITDLMTHEWYNALLVLKYFAEEYNLQDLEKYFTNLIKDDDLKNKLSNIFKSSEYHFLLKVPSIMLGFSIFAYIFNEPFICLIGFILGFGYFVYGFGERRKMIKKELDSNFKNAKNIKNTDPTKVIAI